MFNAGMEQHHNNQLNSYHPLMNHQMQAPHMNGVGGMQVQQVLITRPPISLFTLLIIIFFFFLESNG